MMQQTRREFLKCGGAAAGAFALGKTGLAAPAAKPRNVLFILVDDLGWTDLGCFGSSFYETPHIDRLAREGMRFTAAYAACPVCSPTRASIMTGKYPARLHTTDYFGAAQPEAWKRDTPLLPAPYKEALPLEEITLAEALKTAGYATFFAGKWHLGEEGYWPEDQGFEINRGGWARGGPYGGKKYFSPYGNPRLKDGPEGEHLPDRLASETSAFIEANQDGPFLAYLSFYSVHTPLMTRQELEEKYAKKRAKGPEERWGKEGERKVREVQNHAVYAGMVEAMDAAVGKVLDTLRRLNLEENTAVFLMSDNGGLSTSEGHPTSNFPLRAGKGWLYEGGIREPMIVRCPGLTKPGSRCDTPVISTDFYPTILDLTGRAQQPDQHLDGKSFLSLLQGGEAPQHACFFWHYPHYGNQGGSPGAVIRSGAWKLIEFFEDGHVELYHLVEDIGEQHDLAQEQPERAARLREQLHAWQKEVDAQFPVKNPAYKRNSQDQ